MTTENTSESTAQTVDAETNSEASITLEQALEKIKIGESKFLEAVSARDKAKAKLRELEDTASSAAEMKEKLDALMKEKGSLAEKHELAVKELTSIKDGIKQQVVNASLTSALEAAGAKAPATALKLIDKSKLSFDDQGAIVPESLELAIKEVQDSDPILFGEPSEPKGIPVKRAGEAATEGAYEKEMQSAKSQKEIYAVMKKYGIKY